MRDIAQIRKYVRDFLDLEVDDMTDVLIDTWIGEGYRKIVRKTRRLPHFEDTWTVAAVAGTQAVDRPATCEEIGSIEGPWGNLAYLDEGAARAAFHTFNSGPLSGYPEAWSEHAGQMKVWPVPSQVHSLTVTGWRKPLDWMAGGAGAVPDFPDDCEDTLLAWVMHRAYTHQDDPEMAVAELQRFAASLEEMIDFHNEGPLAAPFVMGGGSRRRPSPYGERPHPTWGFTR